MVTAGQYGEQINHYNVLRTVEDMYALSYAGASATATPISDIWTTSGATPAAPSNLTATAAVADQINLGWTDNSSNESGFLVERSTDNVNFTQIASLGSNVTSYSDTGLTTGTTYYYRVRAYNSAGDSGYSNTANSVAVGAAASFSLSAPSSSTQGTSFSVTVTAQDSAGDTVTFYSGTVQFTSSDSAASLPANSTLTNGVGTFTVTLNTLGKQTVTATDSANSALTATAKVSDAPAAPSNLAAKAVSSSQINLTWTDNSTGETGFLVERSTDGVHFTQIAALGPNVTSYANKGLSRHTKYYYRVRAYFMNPDGSDIYSAYSAVAQATTLRKGAAAVSGAVSQPSAAEANWQSEWFAFASLENMALATGTPGRLH
jgi:hypothetical protein